MDAPLYPPAAAFEQPRHLPQRLSVRTSAIADLQQDPEAVEVLKRNIPAMAERREGPNAIPFEPLSLRDASMFGGVKADVVDRIEAEFVKINVRRGLRP